MSIIVRRINLGKWKDYSIHLPKRPLWKKIWDCWRVKYNAPADAITNCLNTTSNELSVWVVDDIKHVDYALLAMAFGSKVSKLSTIDYILIDEKDLADNGMYFEQSLEDADTAIPQLKCFHHDIKSVHYEDLGKLQDIIVDTVRSGKQRRKTAAELNPMVEKAIDNGWIDYNILSADFVAKLKKKFANKEFVYKPDVQIVSAGRSKT